MDNMQLSVDSSKPVGGLIEKYSNYKWWQGFYSGVSTGASLCFLYVVFLDKVVFRKDH